MTVKQFSEVAAGRIYLNDFGSSLSAVPGSVLFCGYDRAKSFYGKAKIIETENGEKVLQSYNTFVCRITAAGRFVRMWGGYSATTMRHVNSFLSFYDMNGGGKAWWDMQPVETEKPKAADMTPGESLKAMYNRRTANSVNY